MFAVPKAGFIASSSGRTVAAGMRVKPTALAPDLWAGPWPTAIQAVVEAITERTRRLRPSGR